MSDVIEIENLPELTSPTGEDGVVINDDSQPEGSSLKTAITKIKNMFVNGLYLTSGRKFAEEKETNLGSSTTGWVTIAQIASGEVSEAVSGEVTVMSANGYSLTCEYAIRPSSSDRTFLNTIIRVKRGADSGTIGANIVNFRFAKSSTLDNSGVKLQCYIVTEQILYVQLRGNISRAGFPGMVLVTAINEDTPLLPDGSVSSYLEAGTLLLSINNAGTYIDKRLSCYSLNATTLRVTIEFKDFPKQNSTSVTFPTAFNFSRSDGTLIYAVSAGEIVSINQVRDHTVTCIITTTGLTAGENGSAIGLGFNVELS